MQSIGGIRLAVLFQFCTLTLTLAAPSTSPVNATNGPELSSNFIDLKPTNLSTRPPDPYQIRVPGTATSVIFSDYGSILQGVEVLDVLFQGQSAVINGLIASKGNKPIERLAFIFWSGKLYMHIQPVSGGRMKWLMLAQAFEGIVQFMEEFGWMAVKIMILDDEAGPVGTAALLYHRRPGGFGSNGTSLAETS